MKSKKVLVIIGLSVLIVVGLVAGLTTGVSLRNSEREGKSSSDSSTASMVVIFISLLTVMNSKRAADKARQDQENGA